MKIFKFKQKNIGNFTVKSVDFHRNGICGEGFYCGIFTCNAAEDEMELGDFIFTMFASWSGEGIFDTFENASGDYRCAILKVKDIVNGDISSTNGGAWRGDNYYSDIVKDSIKEHQKQFNKHYMIRRPKNE
jgi:hypothetical protein